MAVSQSLSVTEVAGSVNTTSNTSKVRILWQSTQTGDSWNGYTRVAKYYISINGGAEQEYTVSYTLPKASTKTIVDKTITITHKEDGTGSVKVRTWMDTSISAGVVEKSQSLTLTTIARASTISYVSNVTLGNICTLRWTPKSKDYRFKIKFAVGSWSLTTGAIHPNVTSLYTNASYGISIDAANQFTNSKDAEMSVTLYTYADKECTKQIGSADTAKCRVYIPENDATLPTVAMSLAPVSSLPSDFNGLYIQNKTKVKADFTGSKAKYNANISSYSMKVDGTSYGSPYESNLLAKSGEIPVVGVVNDSRGLTASKTIPISVIPYSKPSVVPYTGESSIVCKRCDSEGNITTSGTYLRIKAGMMYSKVIADGVQKNFCKLRFRHKTESATDFSSWIELTTKKRNPKNLIPFPYRNLNGVVYSGSVTRNGVTFTFNADGTITANGTCTNEIWLMLSTYIPIKQNTNYFLSGCPSRGSFESHRLNFNARTADGVEVYAKSASDFGDGVLCNVGTEATQCLMYIVVNSGITFSNEVFKPMLNEGSTAEPYFVEGKEADNADAIIENAVISPKTSYVVQLGAIDDLGEESTPVEFKIPTDQVTVHLRKGGKGIGIGKYSEEDNSVDINEEWVVKCGTLQPQHIASIDYLDLKNFNELIYNTGYYIGTGTPSSLSCSNYPVDEIGVLEVISTMLDSLGCAYQTYRTNTGKIYTRCYYSNSYSNSWTAWKQVTLT